MRVLNTLLLAFLFTGCGTTQQGILDCGQVCQKYTTCRSVSSDSCTSSCLALDRYTQPAFLQEFETCMDKPCDAIGDCTVQAFSSCTADSGLASLASDFCDVVVGCLKGFVTKQLCISTFNTQLGPSLNCVNSAGLSSLDGCVKGVSCGSVNELINSFSECVAKTFGVIISD